MIRRLVKEGAKLAESHDIGGLMKLAAEDFIADMTSRHNTLLLQQNDAILANDVDKARFLAHEAQVYANLAKMVRVEMRELQAQLDHSDAGG